MEYHRMELRQSREDAAEDWVLLAFLLPAAPFSLSSQLTLGCLAPFHPLLFQNGHPRLALPLLLRTTTCVLTLYYYPVPPLIITYYSVPSARVIGRANGPNAKHLTLTQ